MIEVMLVALAGALLSLDRTAFLQIMASQPLVAGTSVGFLLGDPMTGLAIGSILELLWIGGIPLGTSIPPDETAAAVIATSVSIIGYRGIGGAAHAVPIPMMVFSILLSIPLAIAGQWLDICVRKYNKRFVLNADRLLLSGDIMGIEKEHLKGILSFFAASFCSLTILIGSGLLATKKTYPVISLHFNEGLRFSFYLLLSLGIAVSLRTARGKRTLPTFAAGFLLGLMLFSLGR